MKWVYVLQCKDNNFYVGETSRLYRRFWEHHAGRGGLNTSTYAPEGIVAIYKVDTICKFIEYNGYVDTDVVDTRGTARNCLKYFNDDCEDDAHDKLLAENSIAECLMLHNKATWNNIRGGKYTRFDVEYRYPTNDFIQNLPLCHCGLPCDIKKNEDRDYLFFRCAKKNMWTEFREMFDIEDEPCKYFMEYTKDRRLKATFEDRSETLKSLYKTAFWLNNVDVSLDPHTCPCVGGCHRTSAGTKLSYHYEKRNLCFDCFIDKNEELSKTYKHRAVVKCLIDVSEIT